MRGADKIMSKKVCSISEERKKIGQVSPAERDEIKNLFERKNGLTELFRSLSSSSKDELNQSALYDKIVKDMGEVSMKFQQWWDLMSEKHQWENVAGYRWEINFDTCEIFLVKQ